jgi:hypothetical protein
MHVDTVTGIAEGLSNQQRVQLVAILLGIVVFIVVVLLVERRNATHEVVPPGLTGGLSTLDPQRQVYRPPATAIPIQSAREAADKVEAPDPYPVPFLSTGPGAAEPPLPERQDPPEATAQVNG